VLLPTPLLTTSESPIGPAVKAAIRDNLETCAVERGANISYDTLLDEEVLGLGTDTGGDDTDNEVIVETNVTGEITQMVPYYQLVRTIFVDLEWNNSNLFKFLNSLSSLPGDVRNYKIFFSWLG
jgi:hypothetical protein